MLRIRLSVLAGVIGVLPSIATLAQVSSEPAGTVSICSDEPILNAPYSAKRHFTSVTKHADGTTSRMESGGKRGTRLTRAHISRWRAPMDLFRWQEERT